MGTYAESETHLANLKAAFVDFAERSDQFDEAAASLIEPMLWHARWADLRAPRGTSIYAAELCQARLATELFRALPESCCGKMTSFPKTCRKLWNVLAVGFAVGVPEEAAEFEELLFCSPRNDREEQKELRKCLEEQLGSHAERSPIAVRNIIAALRRLGGVMSDGTVHALTKLVSLYGEARVKRSLFAQEAA